MWNRNVLKDDVRIDEEKKYFKDFEQLPNDSEKIRESIWNLSQQSIQSMSSWWDSKKGFTQPIFAEWFYLSICIKAAMYYEYFKRLPTMINEVKDSMKNYNEFLYINWTTIMIIKWSQSLQFRIIKMESEWIERFDIRRVRRKVQTQHNFDTGDDGVT